MIYSFEDMELDTDRFELRRAGLPVPVEPQVFSLLELLVANHRRMVSKEEINLRVWGGRIVSEAALSSRIRSARRALGDDGRQQRLIRTLHNRGFRFVAEPKVDSTVRGDRDPSPAPQPSADDHAGTRPSIAVLPFALLAAEQRYEPLADAIAHDIIVELSRLHWMFVIARGSSFRFRGPGVDLAAAAEILGVRYLLTGSLAVEGRRSAVTVELSSARDGMVMWADRFDGPIDDLLELRVTIAARVVTALEVRIPLAEAERAARLPTENLDAWAAYHRGLWHMYRFNRHDNEIAARMFDRAIAEDRNFARAYAGLSFTHFQNAFLSYTKQADDDRRLARVHAERSLELDAFDPFASLTMGRAAWIGGDLQMAVPWFERAVELSPNYAFAIYNRALADAITGDGAASQANVGRAMALSPVDPLHYAMLATRALSHLVRGEYADARLWGERAAKAPNAHAQVRLIAALACELAGAREAAAHWAAEARKSGPGLRLADFFRSFPFTDADTLAAAKAALRRLGL